MSTKKGPDLFQSRPLRKEVKLMKNTIGDLFLPPLHTKQHPPRCVSDFSGLILASNPYGIVSKLGDSLIDNQ